MREMGLRAIYPKRRLSISNAKHTKYPYLLEGVAITYRDQVWSSDITSIRLPKGGLLRDGGDGLVAAVSFRGSYPIRSTPISACRR